MTSEFKDRHLDLAVRKYKDLNTLNRWIYLIENEVESTDQIAVKHGIKPESLKRAKRVVAQLSEDLEEWTEQAKAAYIRAAREDETKSNIVDAEFEEIEKDDEEKDNGR